MSSEQQVPRRKITVSEVRNSIRKDMRKLPPEKWFGRPLANLVTPFFHALGLSGNQMTVVRTIIAACGLAMLASPLPSLWAVGAVIFYVTYSLDAVDGNLARLHGTVSYLGKYIDGISDGLFHNWAGLMAGIGAYLYFGDGRLLALGAIITTVSLSSDVMRARLSFTREWMTRLTGELTELEVSAAARVRNLQAKIADVSSTGCFVMVAALFFPPSGIVVFLLLASIFQLIHDLVVSVLIIVEANAILRRSRRSIHEVVLPEQAE